MIAASWRRACVLVHTITRTEMHACKHIEANIENACTWQLKPHSIAVNLCTVAKGSLWQDAFKLMPAFDAFVEFRGTTAKAKKFFFTFFLNTLLSTHVEYLCVCSHARKICIFQHNYLCNHCNVCVQSCFMKIEGSANILCCVHAWYGLKGLQGEWVCAVMKCLECIEHYTRIKPSPAAFYFIATVMPSPQIYRWPLIKLLHLICWVGLIRVINKATSRLRLRCTL